jgi:hypothetical protein
LKCGGTEWTEEEGNEVAEMRREVIGCTQIKERRCAEWGR